MLAGDAHDALPAGTEVGGYLIESVLGQGGFGITYKAFNPVTGYRVAIKEFFPQGYARRTGGLNVTFLTREQAMVDWAVRKFRETTTALSGLNHPNIVTVTNYVSANETGYMIMELLEGRTLSEWLAEREGRPTLQGMRGVMDPIMSALSYVHGKGLVHRDVAPDNILVTKHDRPVLIDFGSVSKDLSERTSAVTGNTYRTYKNHFTAPEQRSTHLSPTPLLDVFSVGALFYLGLAGERPADSRDRLDDMSLHGRADPLKPLASFEPAGCPPRAIAAIEAALSMDRSKRPQSVEALRDVLGWGPEAAADEEEGPAEVVGADAPDDAAGPGPKPAKVGGDKSPDVILKPVGATGSKERLLAGLGVAAALGAVVLGLGIVVASNKPASSPVFRATEPVRSGEPLKTFGDWTTYSQDFAGGQGCFAVTVAGITGSELFVLRLRGSATDPKIFLRLGYDPTASQRTLAVGGRNAALTFNGRKGALEAEASIPIVDAMKKANTVSLFGQPGTPLEYFSAKGLTAALENMRTSPQCP